LQFGVGLRAVGCSPTQKIVQETCVFHGYRIRDVAETGLDGSMGRLPVGTTTLGTACPGRTGTFWPRAANKQAEKAKTMNFHKERWMGF